MTYPKKLQLLLALLALALAGAACEKGCSGTGASLKLPEPRIYDYTDPSRLGLTPDGLGVRVGTKAPSFTARNAKGEEVTLEKLLSTGPILLVFYRGGWCPYCNFQIRELSRGFGPIRKYKVTPVAISVDEVAGSALAQAGYEIPFPVLSDPDAKAIEAFHVAEQVTPGDLETLQGYGIDLEAWSKRKHHKIAVPSLFLIDREGVVRWAHADRDYKVRPSLEQIIGAIQAWRASAPAGAQASQPEAK